eukprot:scaffold23863_cov33-Phaeocystis_antarctica.AAC.3
MGHQPWPWPTIDLLSSVVHYPLSTPIPPTTTDCILTGTARRGGGTDGGAPRDEGANPKGASEQLKREKQKSCWCCARIL